jgi:hypothetical protein
MTTKTTNILYWIFTIIFAGLMIFSSIGAVTGNPMADQLIHDTLEYPKYFIPFNGWAKIIGSVIILIPGLKTIKEWAYAGLFFDLIAVVYSFAMAPKIQFDPGMLSTGAWILFGILSYIFWKEKMKTAGN